MRAREEASKARERELEFKARASEEERQMVDLVVQEYADLVRNLEGRKSVNNTSSISVGSASTITLIDNLQDGKSTLHKMLTAFSTESEQLHATIAELNAKVSNLQMTLDAERITASHDRTLLSQTKTELDRLNLEDQTAVKMVARYMFVLTAHTPRLLMYPSRKFSQASINALQQQITTLKARYASTIATLELQLSIADSQLVSERARTTRLQDALDELCEDLARESYGRRREVALRLALLSREEGVVEFMRRWARRARELYARCYSSAQPPAPHVSSEDAVQEAFHRVISDAESLLSALDDDVQFPDVTHTSGSLARMTLAREAVVALRNELQDEVQKRIEAVRKSVPSLPNGHLAETTSRIEDLSQQESIALPSCDGSPDHPPLTPNGNTEPEHQVPPVSSSSSQDADSPFSMVISPEESMDDPFVVPAVIAPPIAEIMDHTIVETDIHSLPSPSIQESISTSATLTLLVDEAPKAVQPHSPAVSMLDIQQALQPTRTEEPSITDMVSIHGLPNGILSSPLEANQSAQPHGEDGPSVSPISISTPMSAVRNAQVPAEDDTPIPSTSISTPPAVSRSPLVLPSPSSSQPTLLFQLGATKHRYDTLQRAFRDCSLALKELKRTLASSSPSSHIQPNLRQHLETALARIDDYAEDARVELEIRVADEELTASGFETVLSVPGALMDTDERAEVEASAREFVDGMEEGVARALEKFGKNLEDVQHDVAVVKRAVHGLAMSEEGGERGDAVDGSKDAGAGWTAWTAGLLGANATPSRSPTPVQTFGAVVTSPRLRHAPSLKQLHGQASTHESPDRGPLAGLNLRIPMPSPSHSSFIPLGLGRAMEGSTRPRTLSTMYALGGLRSSSAVFGVGLGGSPSPARTRGAAGRLEGGLGDTSSPLRDGGARGTNDGELHDLGGVE